MKIEQFIKTDYLRVTMETRVVEVQESINKCRCAVVFNEDGGVAGVLGSGDALKCTGGLIGHCRIEKPCIDVSQSLEQAITLMSSEGTDTLLVYDSEHFLGILAIHDLALQLIARGKSETSSYRVIVHDLRNSISNLQGLNSLLKSNIFKPENLEILELARQSCSHSLEILQEVLYTDNEEDKGVTELFNINAIVHECIKEIKGVFSNKELELVKDFDDAPFYYLINRTDFKRTIHNLVANAVKFSHRGGTIRISSHIEGNIYELLIEDTGIGILEETKPLVFDQFSSASRTGTDGEPSTGIGLHFSRSLIEKFGGTVAFESVEGKGSTFSIQFANKNLTGAITEA